MATRYYEGHRLSPGEMGSFMVCVLLQCPPSPWPLCHHLFIFFYPKMGCQKRFPRSSHSSWSQPRSPLLFWGYLSLKTGFGHVSEDLTPGERFQASMQQIREAFGGLRGALQLLKPNHVPPLLCLCPCLILSIKVSMGCWDMALPTARSPSIRHSGFCFSSK